MAGAPTSVVSQNAALRGRAAQAQAGGVSGSAQAGRGRAAGLQQWSQREHAAGWWHTPCRHMHATHAAPTRTHSAAQLPALCCARAPHARAHLLKSEGPTPLMSDTPLMAVRGQRMEMT